MRTRILSLLIALLAISNFSLAQNKHVILFRGICNPPTKY